MQNQLNRLELWAAPILVLAFATALAVMYGWVGTMKSVGTELRDPPDRPDMENTQMMPVMPPVAQPGNMPNTWQQPGQHFNGQGNDLRLGHSASVPGGIGGNQGQIQLLNNQPPANGYIGAAVSELDQAMAARYGLTANTGLIITSVLPGSPAASAGLAPGIIILQCDNQQVFKPEQLQQILATKQPGQQIPLLVLDGAGRQHNVFVYMATPPQIMQMVAAQKGSWLGADIQNVDMVMKNQMNLPDRQGVIVSQVFPDSPAMKAGLQTGDIIRQVNESPIRDVANFSDLITNTKQGDVNQLIIWRQGNTLKTTVTLGPPPVKNEAPPNIPPATMAIEGTWIGMDISELSKADIKTFSLPVGTMGIVVNDVESPPASTVGFQTGDVLTAVNGTPVPTMREFVKATKMQSGAVVDVQRGNRHLYITVPPPGFSRQGTPIPQANANQNLQQVAMATPVTSPIVAVLALGPQPGDPVSDEAFVIPCVLVVDTTNNSFLVFNQVTWEELIELLQNNQVGTLICGKISAQTTSEMQLRGIDVLSGMKGTSAEALQMYRTKTMQATR